MPRTDLTALDLLALGATLAVCVVAVCSLALAHAHHHSLGGVLVLSAAVGAVLAAVLRRVGLPRPRLDPLALVAVLGCAAVAAVMFLPGFGYGVADKDPGGYVSHAVEIAHSGSYSFVDPALAKGLPTGPYAPGARFPGIWVADPATGLIVPQFYHLWPALMATTYDVGGLGGLVATTPLVGVLVVLVAGALLRRLGGTAAAVAGGLLLATNMVQVWQSKYPTTEVLAELLFLGTLLGLVVALQTRWRPAAGLGGVMVGVGFLNRADGLLLLLLVVAACCVVIALDRADARLGWFLGGVALLFPYAAWQAWHTALTYTRANSLPGWPLVTALLVGGLTAALLLRPVLRRPAAPVLRVADRPRFQLVLGAAFTGASAGLMVLGYLRPRLFGEDLGDFGGRTARTYDEQIMARLTWFVSLPGMALALVGIAVLLLRRRDRLSGWVVVLPVVGLFLVYGVHARNSVRLMWWIRRFVPSVLPGLLLLGAVALGAAVLWRYRGRRVLAVPAVLTLAGLVVFQLGQSLPLRHHDEWGGSFALSAAVADLAGPGEAVYLWQPPTSCCGSATELLATPVWLQHGRLSVALDREPERWAPVVRQYRAAFPDRELFVVVLGSVLPDGFAGLGLEQVRTFTGTLPYWEETEETRPDESRSLPYDFTVFRAPAA